MVFGESTIRIRTRVRSAFGRLRPSKSSSELTPHMESALGQIPGLISAPFLPIPALSLSGNLPKNELLQPPNNLPGQASRTLGPPGNGSSESKKIPVLTQMLEQQGLLNSPISVHLASLVLLGDASDSRVSISTDPKIRSSSDSTYSLGLLCSPSAGPFTPELVSNPVGLSTPEFTASYLSTPELGSSLSASPRTYPLINHERSSLGIEIVSSQHHSDGTETFWITSPNASSFTRKLSAVPARLCLHRPGPIPCSHPISPQLLYSFLAPNGSPRGQAHSDPSMNENDNGSARRSSISAQSFDLECYSPGGNPMDKFTLDGCDQRDLLARHIKEIYLGDPPSLKRRRSAPALSQSKRSSASSFMTNVTGYESLESEH